MTTAAKTDITEQKMMAFLATDRAPLALLAAGWTPSDLRAAGWTPSDLRAAGLTPSDLRAAGWTPSDLRAAGLTPSDLLAAGWTPSDLRAAGWTPSALLAAGWTPSDLRAAGWTPSALRAAGWTPSDLRAAGWTPSAIDDLEKEIDAVPMVEKPYTKLLSDIELNLRQHDQSTFGPECNPATNVCGTPMCTAGHLVNMAGEAGWVLRKKYGFVNAASIIHRKWRPDVPPQNFGSIPQKFAMAYIRQRASEEAATAKEDN